MPSGFRISNTSSGWANTDFDDVFVSRDLFAEGGVWMSGGGYNSVPVQILGGTWKSIVRNYITQHFITTDGKLWGGGTNNEGQVGDGTTINRFGPLVQIGTECTWAKLHEFSSGRESTHAIKTDGTLWGWGRGYCGAMGNLSQANQSSPVQTSLGGTDWKQVAAGHYITAAVKTDGTLWTWGGTSQGALGHNRGGNNALSPSQTCAGGTNWRQVSAGRRGMAATKTDGTLWTWGRGNEGQQGNNSIVASGVSAIQTITGGTDWKAVVTGAYFNVATKTDGTLWFWGLNDCGQLGDNTTINRSSPVQTIAGGTNWKYGTGLNGMSAAIKTDGTLWTWGWGGTTGTRGRLGNNDGSSTIVKRSSPGQTVAGGTNWVKIGASTCALLTVIRCCDF